MKSNKLIVCMVIILLGTIAGVASSQGDGVVIYGQPGCKYSTQARERYPKAQYHDITADKTSLSEMLKLSKGKSCTPIIVAAGVVAVGLEGKT